MRWGWVVLFLSGLLALAPPARGQSANGGDGAGSLGGRLFTADHPESVAVGADVFLIFQDAKGTARQLKTSVGHDGAYLFTGLSTEPTIQYVLRVDFRGENYLGAPSSFTAGQTALDLSFLVSKTAPPAPGGAMGGAMGGGAGEGQLPSGHPPVEGQSGKPVPVNAGHTLLLTLALVLAFGLPVALLARADRRAETPRPSGAIETLLRDIAALDLRYESGVLAREEYDPVRNSLKRRLSELAGKRESA